MKLRCFTIMLTNRCPLSCAHCGPNSGPMEREVLDTLKIIEILDFAQKRLCQMINFSGGEPFMLGKSLVELVSLCSERWLKTRVTTGAYWSRSTKEINKHLEPLAEAGLDQLVISCGDAHNAFVTIENIIEATHLARKKGIDVLLTLGISKNSNISAQTIRDAFEKSGIGMPPMRVSPYIPFGRAKDNFSTKDLLLHKTDHFAGPCNSILLDPAVHEDGRFTGCAVVFGKDCEPLTFGNIHNDSLDSLFGQMERTLLVSWIHKVGVVELKQFIEANTSIIFNDQYVNICHLCGDILSNQDALNFLTNAGFFDPVKDV